MTSVIVVQSHIRPPNLPRCHLLTQASLVLASTCHCVILNLVGTCLSVLQAIEGGFNHIDTAQVYQNEESVGEALRQAFGEAATAGNDRVDIEKQKLGKFVRDDIWVTTKYGGEIDAEEALDISLKKVSTMQCIIYVSIC